MLPLMAWYSDSLDLKLVIPMYLAGLFVCCMFCHGELALLKPAPRYLTTYYLMISLGGAIGGLLVGLAAPYLLTGYFELAIGLVACALLLLYRTTRMAWWAVLGSVAVVAVTAWGAGKAVDYQITTSRVMMRNFYSVLRTREDTTPVPFRSMVHGGIMHGGQLLDPERRFQPSSYFGTDQRIRPLVRQPARDAAQSGRDRPRRRLGDRPRAGRATPSASTRSTRRCWSWRDGSSPS